ncbi:MAG: hypothetical protein ABIR26_17985, partial [Ramlibacter sp.]
MDTARTSPPLQSARSAFLQELRELLPQLPELLMQMQPHMEQGITLASLKEMSQDDIEETYRIGHELTCEGAWDDALSVMLYLVAHCPFEARFQFAAGMC